MKENLLRVKRLLERKCFASNNGSEYEIEPYLEVIKSINNEEAFNHIQEYINNSIRYYSSNCIEYDEIDLYLRFSLYFDSKYSDRYPYTINNNIKPIQDILRVYVTGVGYEKNKKKSTIDPDEISTYQEFIITFTEFKSMIEESGLILGYSSFEDILEDYRNYKQTVCMIVKCNNKVKKMVGER